MNRIGFLCTEGLDADSPDRLSAFRVTVPVYETDLIGLRVSGGLSAAGLFAD